MAKKYRKMLTDWQAPYILPIMQLVQTQSKETIINWCVGYCDKRMIDIYEKAAPNDTRARDALSAAKKYIKGEIKLPEAKKVIRECQAAAREAEKNPTAQAAARTIAQCASSIYNVNNCAALIFYGALAAAYDALGIDAEWDDLLTAAEAECNKIEAALRAVAVENEPNPANITWEC